MKKEVSFLICGVLIGALAATCGFALFLRGAKDGSAGGNADGSAGGNAKVVLKLGHGLDVSHPVHKAMEFMNERLVELSGGTVEIDARPSDSIALATKVRAPIYVEEDVINEVTREMEEDS